MLMDKPKAYKKSHADDCIFVNKRLKIIINVKYWHWWDHSIYLRLIEVKAVMKKLGRTSWQQKMGDLLFCLLMFEYWAFEHIFISSNKKKPEGDTLRYRPINIYVSCNKICNQCVYRFLQSFEKFL